MDKIDPLTKKFQSMGLYCTYRIDLKLFSDLGLKPFSNAPYAEIIQVGKIERDGASATISVQCWPAQFWSIIIHDPEREKTYEMNTGSGNLSKYWPFVEQIMNGMVSITVLGETN